LSVSPAHFAFPVPRRKRRRVRVGLLYVRALIAEFRWTLFGLLIALSIGTAVILLSPEVRFDGKPPTVPMAIYSAWMSLLAQPTLNPPPSEILMVLFAVYPLLGFGLIGEGIVRLGFLMVSRRRGEKEWTLVMASTYRDHVILCGLGHLGIRVLEQYIRAGIGVVVIERDEKNPFIARAKEWNVPVLLADMKDDQSLLDAGIKHARAVVMTTNDDVANLEVALDSRRMNPNARVCMRLFDQQLASKITGAFGIDTAFSASALAAPLVAGMSVGASVLSTAVVAGQPHVIAEMAVASGSQLAGKTVGEVEAAHAARVLALRATEATAETAKSPPLSTDSISPATVLTIHIAADRLASVAAAARG
jgi:Trk K+ transport system NAD-binding subunit